MSTGTRLTYPLLIVNTPKNICLFELIRKLNVLREELKKI